MDIKILSKGLWNFQILAYSRFHINKSVLFQFNEICWRKKSGSQVQPCSMVQWYTNMLHVKRDSYGETLAY